MSARESHIGTIARAFFTARRSNERMSGSKGLAKKSLSAICSGIEESISKIYGIPCFRWIAIAIKTDSSMPEQIADKLFFAKPLLPFMRSFERRAAKKSLAVVPMCDSLADIATKYGARKVVPLRDISLLGTHKKGSESRGSSSAKASADMQESGVRGQLGIKGTCFMYIGNLEKYQGIDLLLESFSIFKKQGQEGSLVIVGGIEKDIVACKARSKELKIDEDTHFMGPRPLSAMKSLFVEADVLVSPRAKGKNTPMKIYSYLDSGKPILATDLPTHTQVLNNTVAELVPPEADKFAAGMLRLAESPELRDTLSREAKILAEEKYSTKAFESQVNELYGWVNQQKT
jgi:glycosyltransferase involved in cell wall biosynthesis